MTSLEYPIIWPDLSEEFKPFKKYCQGLVLNAGSGQRELGLGERELNIDIVSDNEPDIIGDLHSIPLLDQTVDTVVSIAVLEHTKFPWIVAQEFYRVLKPGGHGVIAVPFIQPQHACPDDYCRFTENGLIELSRYTGFEVIETAHVHHFGQTIAWLLWEYLQENMPQSKLLLRFWFWLIRQLSKGNFLSGDSSNTHNTHYIVVRKPGHVQQSAEAKALLREHSKTWFFPLLSCPTTRQPLHLKDNYLVTEDGKFSYVITNTRPTLLPHTDPRTWKTVVIRQDEVQDSSVPMLALPSSSGSDIPTGIQSETAASMSVEASQLRRIPFSKQVFNVTFKAPFIEQLRKANLSKIAVLATNEFEGIFRNGGIGTHYKTLSEQLAKNGWQVILLLCTYDQSYGGTSSIAAVNNIFSIRELNEVLNLQPIHHDMLGYFQSEWKRWIDHQSFSCLLFTQAISNLFHDLPIYIEFHEMSGIGYHTIQAKRSHLLGPNCVVSVTMHSGHEWIYEANEWFTEEYPSYYSQACDYEQISFEDADLAFFPSHYLKEKVETYGWRTGAAKHMPYFIPIIQQSALQADSTNEVALTAAFDHPRSKIPLIFFGRLEMRKGIMTFVESIKLLSLEVREQIHIHFVGKVVRLHTSKFGDLESDRYIQQELEGKVTYTLHSNFYSHQAIQFIRALKSPIVCLASHQENFPNTGLEMGQLPVSLVVSDTGGFRETLKFVNRNTGVYWFKPADPMALSTMLSKAFLNQPELPEVPDIEELEETNRQLWARKLAFIEAALHRETAEPAVPPNQPKVTIGVTCNKVGTHLMDCLISIEAQTFDNLEVIVIDDASHDAETQQAIEQAKSIFQTYQFVQAETDSGLDTAQNRLIELAEGDYFIWLSADTYLFPFAVETFTNAAVHAQAEVVVCPRTVAGTDTCSDITFRRASISTMLKSHASQDVCSLFSLKLLKKFQQLDHGNHDIQNWSILSAAIATASALVHYPYPLCEPNLFSASIDKASDSSKERYYLRQYLATIPPAEWSPRQINMLMLTIQELDTEVGKLQVATRSAQSETERTRLELEEVRQKLKNARGRLKGMRENLDNVQCDLQSVNNRIVAMETSKFWKLRKSWFKIKKILNLPSNE